MEEGQVVSVNLGQLSQPVLSHADDASWERGLKAWVRGLKACFRLVLEVLGFAGPFVAAGELIGEYATDDALKKIVAAMLALGGLRWFIKEITKQNCPDKDQKSYKSGPVQVIEGIFTFILQVPGAMGAIWGGSDVLRVRDEHAEVGWKWASYGAGLIALPLWLMGLFKKRDKWLSTEGWIPQFFMVYSALVMFIQQVFGAGGAIWGPSSALGVRPNMVSDDTVDYVAMGAMVLGLFYWGSELLQMHAYPDPGLGPNSHGEHQLLSQV